MRIEIGKRYRLRDGGTIHATALCQTDTESVVRCVTETGETVFYDQRGRILPPDGGKELARFNVEGEHHG